MYVNGNQILSVQMNGLVNVDNKLSGNSENPVQNKAIANAVSNTLRGSETGLKTVSLKDVSPIEHLIDVKVSPNSKIAACGKNLFDQSTINNYTLNGVTVQYFPNEDYFLINGTATENIQKMVPLNIPCKQNSLYTISTQYIDGLVTYPNGTGDACPHFGFNDDFNTSVGLEKFNVKLLNENNSKSFKVTKKYCTYSWFYITSGISFVNYKFRVQLEENPSASEFEHFIEPTEYTADDTGKINIQSFHPYMYLYSENDDETITAQYNKDLNKVITDIQTAISQLQGTTAATIPELE